MVESTSLPPSPISHAISTAHSRFHHMLNEKSQATPRGRSQQLTELRGFDYPRALEPTQNSQEIQPRNAGSKHPHGETLNNGAQDLERSWEVKSVPFPFPNGLFYMIFLETALGLKLSELASENTHTKTSFVFIWNSNWTGHPLLIWQPCVRPNSQLCLLRLFHQDDNTLLYICFPFSPLPSPHFFFLYLYCPDSELHIKMAAW